MAEQLYLKCEKHKRFHKRGKECSRCVREAEFAAAAARNAAKATADNKRRVAEIIPQIKDALLGSPGWVIEMKQDVHDITSYSSCGYREMAGGAKHIHIRL